MSRPHPTAVLTTGEAAKIARVSQQTIIRACDQGQLQMFFVPGSNHRRVLTQSLYEFLEGKKFPPDEISKIDPCFRLLTVGEPNDSVRDELKDRIMGITRQVRINFPGFPPDLDKLREMLLWIPDAILLFKLPDERANQFATSIGRIRGLEGVPVVVYLPSTSNQNIAEDPPVVLINGRSSVADLCGRLCELADSWSANGVTDQVKKKRKKRTV